MNYNSCRLAIQVELYLPICQQAGKKKRGSGENEFVCQASLNNAVGYLSADRQEIRPIQSPANRIVQNSAPYTGNRYGEARGKEYAGRKAERIEGY